MDLECDILKPIFFSRKEEIEQRYGPGSYPVHTVGKTHYHWFLALGPKGYRGKLPTFWFYISQGRRLHKALGFDCIVTYSHMMTGVSGAILKLLTGAKLIVEIVTAPDRSYLALRQHPTLSERMMQRFSDVCLHISLLSCDLAHLLGPRLIASYKWLRKVHTAVFPEFVPLSLVPHRRQVEEQYILFVGAPWYLKGVDLLVEAFSRLAGDFPDVRLKIVGWFPERDTQEVAGGTPQIEVLKPKPNPEILEMMGKAMIFVLPSRCEGTPCVILEAMAAGLPIVASDVGGIPVLVRDGDNGFLVPVGDIAALEDRLRRLLADRVLRERMGARSYDIAHTEFSEKVYRARFTSMIGEVVNSNV